MKQDTVAQKLENLWRTMEEPAVSSQLTAEEFLSLKDTIAEIMSLYAEEQHRAGITHEQHQAEIGAAMDALQLSEERFQLVSRATKDCIWDWNIETNTVWWNDNIESVFGYKREEVRPDASWWAERIHPDDRERILADVGEHLQSDKLRWTGEYRYQCVDGRYAHVLDRGFIVRDASGKAVRMIGSETDISELRRLEKELSHAQKMEAVATLASGVAHDFNNLLMGIQGCVELALKMLPPEHPAAMYMDEVRRATRDGAALTGQLLAFARPQEARVADIELDELIEGSERMLHSLLSEHIELRLQLGARGWLLRGNAVQLGQVLMNFAVNARDAMPGGGVLSVATDKVKVGPHGAAQSGTLEPGEYIKLTIRDTGVGMSSETLARIFEPFFTTKELGRGTGLGLSTVYGIVNQVGGHIQVQSGEGEGTTFTLYFPRSEPEIVDPELATGNEAGKAFTVQGDQATVLLVEDEPLVRMALQGYLQPRGFHLLTACDATEVSLTTQRSEVPIDLVITDVMLPGYTGKNVAEMVTAQWPRAKVIYISAYPAEILARKGYIPATATTLQKPFTEERLMIEISRVMGGSGASGKSRETAFADKDVARPETALPEPGPNEPGSTESGPTESGPTVLLVEDNRLSRLVMHKQLETSACTILEALSGVEALDLWQAHGEQVDVVVTDLGLPDMSGEQLINELRSHRPDIPIICISGHAETEPVVQRLLGKPRVRYMQKPVATEVLARMVHELVR